MVKKTQQYKVVKVPLNYKPKEYPQYFPRMPRLYLELIENKDKIKQDLINKEYIPREIYTEKPEITSSPDPRNGKKVEEETIKAPEKHDRKEDRKYNRKEVKKDFESRLDRLLSDDDTDDSKSNIDDDRESSVSSFSDLTIQEAKKSSRISSSSKDSYSTDDSDALSARLKQLLNDDSDSERGRDDYSRSRGDKHSRDSSKYSGGDSIKYRKHNRDDRYERHNRDTRHSEEHTRPDKYSRTRDIRGHSVSNVVKRSAPTLAELEQRGGYVPRKELRNINQSAMQEHQEEDAKRELLFRFELLKKSYPDSTIPEYNIHTDIDVMRKSYDDTLRRLSLDSSVATYKTYLVYGFMGCEYILGSFFGFDMQGFTQQQIVSMNSYEKLLIELGEKSYVPTGSKWPVEIRLAGMIIMNAVVFIVGKMMMKKTGANVLGMLNSMNSTSQAPQVAARKRRMKGPNIDIDNLPDLSG
jgi:hypothetical protein